ncbi:MAG TPA: hypothetical protein PL001_00495, partial [Candidatus Kryptobacter bacterium]|nr:hypothetical protein [Candidatus Kryptobacter bacterium]
MRYAFALIVLVAVGMAGCGGSKGLQTADTGGIHEWYMNPPQDPHYLYAANTQSSQDMQLAV